MKAWAAGLLALLAGAGCAACGDGNGEERRPSDASAIAAAEAYARSRGADVRRDTQVLHSARDPDWAVALGASGRRGLWAVWLRAAEGRWQPRHIMRNGKGETRPAEVPCDIKPAYSEPDCPPQE